MMGGHQTLPSEVGLKRLRAAVVKVHGGAAWRKQGRDLNLCPGA